MISRISISSRGRIDNQCPNDEESRFSLINRSQLKSLHSVDETSSKDKIVVIKQKSLYSDTDDTEKKKTQDVQANVGVKKKTQSSFKNENKSFSGQKENVTKCKMTFLFDPDGRFSYCIVAFLYNLWVIFYRYSFNEINSENKFYWFFLDYFADLLYLFDIFFNFRTGFLEEGVLQTDPMRLRHHYMNTTRFYVDLLCLIPLDILYLSIGFYSIFRIFRLVKVYKLIDILDRTERHINYPNAFRILVMLHHLFAVFHFNTCFSYSVSNYLSEDFMYISKKNNVSFSNGFQEISEDPLKNYLQAFYFTSKIMTMVGDFPNPQTNADYIFTIFQLIFALLLFATIMGQVTYIVSNLGNARKDFQSKFAAVKSYMSLRRVPKHLQKRVIRWFDFLWTNHKSTDENQVLNLLPYKLRAEISIHVHLDTLKRVEIFQNTEAGFLNELVLRLKPILYSPGDFICRKGEVGKEMYIVNSGRLQVISDNGKVVLATLKAGSYFGEISILNMGAMGNRRTASVKSVGYSDLFCLSKEDLWEVLKEYPAVRIKLESIAVKRLEKHKKPLSEIVNMNRCKSLPILNDEAPSNYQWLREKRPTLPTHLLTNNDISELVSSTSNQNKSSQVKRKEKIIKNTSFKPMSNVLDSDTETESDTNRANRNNYPKSRYALMEEIEKLKRCMKFLENENEILSQKLEKQDLSNLYEHEIERLLFNDSALKNNGYEV